jgi:hypothetical protein
VSAGFTNGVGVWYSNHKGKTAGTGFTRDAGFSSRIVQCGPRVRKAFLLNDLDNTVHITAQLVDFIGFTGVAHQAGFELGGGPKRVHVAQPADHWVPTGAVLVHHPSLACIHERATGGKPSFALDRRRRHPPPSANSFPDTRRVSTIAALRQFGPRRWTDSCDSLSAEFARPLGAATRRVCDTVRSP